MFTKGTLPEIAVIAVFTFRISPIRHFYGETGELWQRDRLLLSRKQTVLCQKADCYFQPPNNKTPT